MSDMINHLFCGRQARNRLEDAQLRRLLEAEEKYYLTGCMGGDLFFYYNAFPWKRDAGINKIGSKFHHGDENHLFKIFYDYLIFIKEKVSEEEYKKAKAYVMGFICHHGLDSATHPFVTSSAGFVRKKTPDSIKHKYMHKRLEALLDYYMIKRLGKQAELEDFDKVLKYSHNEIKPIYDFYTYVLNIFLHMTLPYEVYEESLHDARSLFNLSRKNTSLNTVLFSAAESIIGKKHVLTQIILKPTKREEALDVMNLNHAFWVDPCCREEMSNYSYPELFEMGIERTRKNIDKFEKLLEKGSASQRDIDRIFKGIGFDTGRNCEVSQVKYAMSVFYGRKFEEIG